MEIAPDFFLGPVRHFAPAFRRSHVAKLNTGRAAIYTALREILRIGGKKKAWIPAYVCASVGEAFMALGFDVDYYASGDDLVAQKFPEEISRGATFLYVHYFGKRNNDAIEWMRTKRKSSTFFVIEDCVQASLNANVGYAGDYAVTSYRKFLPQPDGAFLWSDIPMEIHPMPSDEAFISAKFVGKLLRSHAGRDATYLPLLSRSEEMLERDFEPRTMSWVSAFMMDLSDIPAISEQRRNNWDLLSGLIEESSSVSSILSPLFDTLDAGEVPVGFPVKVKDERRDDLRLFLADRQIYCPVHWELPHLRPSGGWKEEKKLSSSILTLPIDQRLGAEHMRHMVQTLDSFEAGS